MTVVQDLSHGSLTYIIFTTQHKYLGKQAHIFMNSFPSLSDFSFGKTFESKGGLGRRTPRLFPQSLLPTSTLPFHQLYLPSKKATIFQPQNPSFCRDLISKRGDYTIGVLICKLNPTSARAPIERQNLIQAVLQRRFPEISSIMPFFLYAWVIISDV